MGNLSAYNTSTFSGSFDRGNINVAISSSIVSGSTGNIRFGDTPNPPLMQIIDGVLDLVVFNNI